ncbi:MAG: SMC-Scp complex subunit ScpB [Gemmataceae bacterium]
MRQFLEQRRGPEHRRPTSALPCDHGAPLARRLAVGADGAARVADPLARDAGLALVEAALFAADEPLSPRKLAQLAGLADGGSVRRLLRTLQAFYEESQTAFQVEEVAGGFQLLTRPAFHRWLAGARRQSHDLRLTPAMRETLAIIAYRQPIMRAEIESIRGVQCAETLRLLMEKGLVRITGRHDSLGRPVLYGTTRKFLQIYGLKGLEDLPKAEKPSGS